MKSIIGLLLAVLFVSTAFAQPLLENNLSLNETVLRYPILGERPFPHLKGEDLKRSQDALVLARLLTQDCRCDEALADYGIESLHELLKMRINFDMFDGRTSTLEMSFPGRTAYRQTIASHFGKTRDSVAALVISKTFTGSAKMIFLNSYFFDPTLDTTTATQQRAIILIHESVHQFAGEGDQVFGGSRALTGRIVKKCLPGLNSVNRLGNITVKD